MCSLTSHRRVLLSISFKPHCRGACSGVETEASREEGRTEGCVLWELGASLILSSLLHSTGVSSGFGRKQMPCPEGGQGSMGGGWLEEKAWLEPSDSLGPSWVGQYRSCSWAPGKAGTIVLQPED